MCGRFALDLTPNEVQHLLNDSGLPVNEITNQEHSTTSYNFAPGKYSAVYRLEQNSTGDKNGTVQYMKWGLVPSWSKEKPNFQQFMRTYNARAESIFANSRLWNGPLSSKRCVIPVSGYYEWQHKSTGPKKSQVDKIPYYVHKEDRSLIYLAGLWEEMGYTEQTDTTTFEHVKLYTFTIITTKAPEQLAWLHERMPVVLNPNTPEFEKWLQPGKINWKTHDNHNWLKKILKSYEEYGIAWYKVSKDIGKMSNDGKYLSEKLKEKTIGDFFKTSNSIPKHDNSELAIVKSEIIPKSKEETTANTIKSANGINSSSSKIKYRSPKNTGALDAFFKKKPVAIKEEKKEEQSEDTNECNSLKHNRSAKEEINDIGRPEINLELERKRFKLT